MCPALLILQVGNTEIAAASVISTVAVLCSIVARSGRMFRREYAGNIWGEGVSLIEINLWGPCFQPLAGDVNEA